MTPTDCPCTPASLKKNKGVCPVHNRAMPPAFHRACKTDQRFYDLFAKEAAAGKYNGTPRPDPFACIHRGPLIRHEPCKLCGNKKGTAEIFACPLHEECSLKRFKSGQRIQACITCQEREPG